MIRSYVQFGVSIAVVSWMVGIALIGTVARSAHFERLQHLNFVPSDTANRYLGLAWFQWIVRHTPVRFFNQQVRLRAGRADLVRLRHEMTLAEVSHLIAFVFVALVAVYMTVTVGVTFGAIILGANTVLNLYPALLQQANKRRIDRLRAARDRP